MISIRVRMVSHVRTSVASSKWGVLACLVLLACKGDGTPSPRFERILRTAADARADSIQAMSPEEQVQFYLTAVESYHPPLLGTRDEVAASGSVIRPALVSALQVAETDTRRANLVHLAAAIICSDSSSRRDTVFMTELERVAHTMRGPRAQIARDALGRPCIENRASP